MPAVSQPTHDQLGTFLSRLLGLDVTVQEDSAAAEFDVHALSEFRNEVGEVEAFVAFDIASAAKLAAALTQIPTGAIEEAIKGKELPENLADNLREVVNIFVNVFPQSNAHRLSSDGIAFCEAAKEIFNNAADTSESVCYKIDISRYGEGAIWLTSRQ